LTGRFLFTITMHLSCTPDTYKLGFADTLLASVYRSISG